MDGRGNAPIAKNVHDKANKHTMYSRGMLICRSALNDLKSSHRTRRVRNDAMIEIPAYSTFSR